MFWSCTCEGCEWNFDLRDPRAEFHVQVVKKVSQNMGLLAISFPLSDVLRISFFQVEQDCCLPFQRILQHRGSYMSAHVFLNLLNELGKRDKMRGLPSILFLFRNEFNKFNNTRARMLDFIYHMTNTLKSHF